MAALHLQTKLTLLLSGNSSSLDLSSTIVQTFLSTEELDKTLAANTVSSRGD